MTRHAQVNGVGNTGIGELAGSELATLAKDNPHQVFLISDLGRPGFGEFLQELEYRLYTPDTNPNLLFEMFVIQWESRVYVIAAFPQDDLPTARQIAADFGIRLNPGTMICISSEHPGPQAFPMEEAENVFIAAGVCERLRDISEEERKRLFLEREAQLRKQYHIL